MRERGFLERESQTAYNLVKSKLDSTIISASKTDKISDVIALLTSNNISQLPVIENEEIVGAIYEKDIFKAILQDSNNKSNSIEGIIKPPFPVVEANVPIEELSKLIDKDNTAITVKLSSGFGIITRHDIIESLAK